MADWKDEARGIPVWVGAHFYEDDGTLWVATDVVDLADTDAMQDDDGFDAPWPKGTFVVYARIPNGCGRYDARDFDMDECAPALDNPDTQAAYLRRLALRLGCPEEVAGEGVMFMRSTANPSEWLLTAGHSFCHIVLEDTDDRLLALVRAWTSA